ncbi:unnamed protein product [Enterobius vermicularis]|uniref:Uncharacterized protein n=1 Tax=Enterobius vermicularis TaxID=51028 RepID=A0A3P6H7C7_ENTVE|nr:unnamed protein product [Enterobius vermicularis]
MFLKCIFSDSRLQLTASESFQGPSPKSPPPIPVVPPPVSPLSPASSEILGRKTERQWSSSSQGMAATVETTLRQWSAPIQRDVQGQPPRQDDNPVTVQAESRRSEIRTVTPNYKLKTEKPGYEMKIGSTSNLPEAVGDYKVKETQDHYKLQIIEPKVTSNANMPASSQKLPSSHKSKLDFPSEHSRRSFLNLEPLEQRRIRSVETRPITTSAYLTESVDRHRQMEASRLKEYLKAKENEANKPWNRPDWPGPKPRDDQSQKELEEIRKRISLRTQSMGELMLEPSEGAEKIVSQPEELSTNYGVSDSGWLVKLRKNRYLDSVEEAESKKGMRRTRSVDYLKRQNNVPTDSAVSAYETLSSQAKKLPNLRSSRREMVNFTSTVFLLED